MAIDAKLLSDVFKGKTRHNMYGKAVTMYHKMKIHMDGIYPEKLIGERRPGEEEKVQVYREKIWSPITMEPLAKIESSLQKIRKSADWSVRHNPDAWSKAIAENETPQKYFEEKYPVYGYMGAWLFSEVVRNYMIDANAWVAVLPLDQVTDPAEYVKPYPYIFNSSQALFFNNEVAIFNADDINDHDADDIQATEMRTFWVFTTTEASKYIKTKDSYDVVYNYVHNLGYIPAFKIRGIYIESEGANILHRSRFYAMCSRLDEAVREYSDLQAEIVQHIHSESWEIRFPDCKTCKGTGKALNASGEGWGDCKRCKGSGYDASPYSKLSINPNAMSATGQPIPTPPKGYVQKQTDIAKLQDERVDAHIYKALSAVNFQFLAQTQLNQSGVAKEVDRDELNNTVHSVAEDLVGILLQTYAISIDMRYSAIMPDADARKAMIPVIAVPERYDLLNTAYLLAELKQAIDSGVSPEIIAEMQVELANKKFYNNPEVTNVVALKKELDPLPGYSQDDKMAMEMNGWVSKEDAVISSYIAAFIRRALIEDANFAAKTYEEKMAKMREYAATKITPEPAPVPLMPTEDEDEENGDTDV